MKKNLLLILISAACWSCNGNGKIDESKINEAGEKLQKEVKKGTDSLGKKLKRLKNKIDTADTN